MESAWCACEGELGTGTGTGNRALTVMVCSAFAFCCRVDFLTHDISWHVPHHVSTKIPWYNLRAATNSLRENWGQ